MPKWQFMFLQASAEKNLRKFFNHSFINVDPHLLAEFCFDSYRMRDWNTCKGDFYPIFNQVLAPCLNTPKSIS